MVKENKRLMRCFLFYGRHPEAIAYQHPANCFLLSESKPNSGDAVPSRLVPWTGTSFLSSSPKCTALGKGAGMIDRVNRPVRGVALTLVSLVTPPTFLYAQSPPSAPTEAVTVGDPRVDGSFLKPYKNAWKVVSAFPGKEPFLVGTWTDELAAVEINGRHLLKRTQMADYAKYNIVTTYVNVFDPQTMSPVYMEFKRSDTGEWAS